MNIFDNVAAQGDLMIHRVDALPKGLVPFEPENGEFILAHSETGHHHVLERTDVAEVYVDPENPLVKYIQFLADTVAADRAIKHKRSHDTHATIAPANPGIYRIVNQREYTAEGFRRAAD